MRVFEYPFYPFNVEERVPLELPQGAQILSVQVKGGTPCLWALVDPEAALEPRPLRVSGTGWEVERGHLGHFLGTIQLRDGALVFHVFEEATNAGDR